MRKIFASFATDNMAEQRDRLCDSALSVGFDAALRWSPKDYAGSEFEKRNQHILSKDRGAGYWLWKPYLILQAVSRLSADDVLVYCDAGRASYYDYSLRIFPAKLIALANAKEKGFLLGPVLKQHGPLIRWTKRDCLKIMDMDCSDIHLLPSIQATWSIWTSSPSSISFLQAWLKYCEDFRCLTDSDNVMGFENYPDFVDHRHDQAILTLLAYKLDASFLDFSKTRLFNLLKLRSKSGLSNQFLRRIDDSELILSGKLLYSLVKAFVDIKK